MSLEKFLADKKASIVNEWVDALLNTYESPGFFKKQKDCIANPVGFTVKEELRKLFSILASGDSISETGGPLDAIVKIRAVQEFTAAMAVCFIFDLKKIVRDALAKEKAADINPTDLGRFEHRIDQAALLAFDLYMENRERLFKVRLRELQSGRHILTDGTQCLSANIRRMQKESTVHNQTSSSTEAR